MEQEMLRAAREATWAAQSAADAAWWGLLANGVAAAGTLGALIVAITLALQGIFEARARDRTFLVAVAVTLNEIGSVARAATKFRDAGFSDDRITAALTGPLRRTRAMEILHNVDITRFPNEESLTLFRSGIVAAEHIFHRFEDEALDTDRIVSLADKVLAYAKALHGGSLEPLTIEPDQN